MGLVDGVCCDCVGFVEFDDFVDVFYVVVVVVGVCVLYVGVIEGCL